MRCRWPGSSPTCEFLTAENACPAAPPVPTELPDSLRYLAVEGAMGLGKSDLARRLARRFGARLVLERLDENPFLARFWSDPQRWAFQAQVAFLTGRYRQQRTMRSLDLFHHGMVADYTFDKDRIFAELNLHGDDLALYERLYAQMSPATPRPDLVVFLQGNVGHAVNRIRRRGRSFEIGMDDAYIADVHHAYTEHFFRYTKSPLLIINADEMDFAGCTDDFEELVRQVVKPSHHGITYLRPMQRGLYSQPDALDPEFYR